MMHNHPLRNDLIAELHLRRLPAMKPPMQIIQMFRSVESDQREVEQRHVKTLANITQRYRHGERFADARFDDGREIQWERHSEASTATLLLPAARHFQPIAELFASDAAAKWLDACPGEIMRAVRVIICTSEADATDLIANAQFDGEQLVSCNLDGGARLWTDFLIHDDGFGLHVLAANGMAATDLGRCVQRLQELCNYRNIALIGLRAVQAQQHLLGQLEQTHTALTNEVVAASDDGVTLQSLIALAGQVAALTATTSYRLSATRAYGEIVMDRLHALAPQPIAGFQNLTDFTERRLLPALRTCQSFADRLDRLSQQIERTTTQLRARIEYHIQSQNSRLLASMDQTSARQLKLQHLVENLSVVAVSYYALGIVGHLIPGLDIIAPQWNLKYVEIIATVAVVIIVFFGMRRSKKRSSLNMAEDLDVQIRQLKQD